MPRPREAPRPREPPSPPHEHESLPPKKGSAARGADAVASKPPVASASKPPRDRGSAHRSKKNTSLGGGKVRQGHRVHGAPSSSRRGRDRNEGAAGGDNDGGDNNGNHRDRSKSREGGRSKSRERPTTTSSSRAASKSRERKSSGKQRREYDTPFDSKGRCHHHKNVQLAAKKMTGGWKMLHATCPKCMEDKFNGGDDDNRSVRSNSSRKSGGDEGGGGGGDARGQFDKNGCCVLHTHIQVAKKRVFGTGFKVVRTCPACDGEDVGADDISLSSKRSASSRKSTRSAKSSASRAKPGRASKSGRYGSLPFDGDGYCCRHPNVQLAKKKALGGFKIIHNVCPECAHDDDGSSRSGRRKKPSRRKSGTGRVFDDSGSDTSSFKSGKSGKSSSGRKKRIRVRNLRTEDEDGKHGRYTGDVDDDHRPHGNGVMKYEDGTVYDGVWSEGSKVHGKTKGVGGKKR
eukprot:CAMPEP_0181126750 /NCGR_PEP_ID=MMETSP1071-20121207/27809_1 /TAXON_ID=35127 /ORGANISM="Thalassiosira sp., Strain NH16" /LENGTH=458 /DNA_ID=CAMNT_0023212399 /DNA_START=115 /DNA_END=1491 /DNA_ORIENTATION=+